MFGAMTRVAELRWRPYELEARHRDSRYVEFQISRGRPVRPVPDVRVHGAELWLPTKKSKKDLLPGVKFVCTIGFKSGPASATPILFLVNELDRWQRIHIGTASPYTPEVRVRAGDRGSLLVAIDDAMQSVM